MSAVCFRVLVVPPLPVHLSPTGPPANQAAPAAKNKRFVRFVVSNCPARRNRGPDIGYPAFIER